MYFSDVYEKIIFIVILSASFYNIVINLSMNKAASFFKLLGMVFLIPFLICSSVFVYSAGIPAAITISLSEFNLSLGILLLFIFHNQSKNHNIKTAVIIACSVIAAIYAVRYEGFLYYKLSANVRSALTAAFITASIFYINKRKYEKKLIIPLSILLGSIIFGFFPVQTYLAEIILITKAGSYGSFVYYFYSTTYNAYMKKINESEKMIETMERSLNKEVKKRVFEIERSNERLLEISKTDLLTKAFNKITTLNIIEKLISSKKEEVFSIMMFDIDNFKIINDSLGHVTGDMCLKTLAYIASSNIREVDYLGRYGGDEFIIILPSLSSNEAKFVAERFKTKVNETSNPKLTVSIGIATYPYDGKTVKELITVADKGLYKSKSKGKNSISHASLF